MDAAARDGQPRRCAGTQRRTVEDLARVTAAKAQGKSTRQIAQGEGISQPWVLSDIRAATDKGLSVDPSEGKVMSRDGKERPAAKLPPRHPHSDRIDRWLLMVKGGMAAVGKGLNSAVGSGK